MKQTPNINDLAELHSSLFWASFVAAGFTIAVVGSEITPNAKLTIGAITMLWAVIMYARSSKNIRENTQ